MVEPPPWRRFAPEDALGVLALFVILVVMSLGVFYRYVLNDSLTWSEELARYGLVYMTFIGCATGFRRGSHIRIDLVDHLLPARVARVLAILVELLSLVVVAYLAWLTARIMGILHTTRSAALGIPMSWVYLALLIGFSWASVRLLARLWSGLRGLRP